MTARRPPEPDRAARKQARAPRAGRRQRWFAPRDSELGPHEIQRGLRFLLFDGVSSQVMGALTGGALLVAFALQLGASNKVIGLIAAVGPLSQLLQLPATVMVERLRRRKVLVVLVSLVGRLFWVVVAAIPFVVPPPLRVAALLCSLTIYFAAASFANAAYNSWKRDLVPDHQMGRYFARRLTIATAAGAAVTLASGFFVDYGEAWLGDPLKVLALLFLAGGISGLLGVAFLGSIPEPRMSLDSGRPIREVLAEPLRDENFRKLLLFLASWNFAVNLAAPFFAVYMLARLGLPMAWVLGLSVISQLANVTFFRIWGGMADRIGNKAVLSLSGSLFVVSIGLWPFTTLPERYLLTVPLLLAIHLLAGISTAGVNLCAGGITLKLAPRGRATAFLATNALTSGLAATVAPVLAGLLADWVANQRLALNLEWTSPAGGQRLLTALDLSGLDFLFVVAVLLGLYSLHRLLAVREVGAVEEPAAVAELYGEMRRAVRHVSNVAGLRRLTTFPYHLLGRQRPDPVEAEEEDRRAADEGSGD